MKFEFGGREFEPHRDFTAAEKADFAKLMRRMSRCALGLECEWDYEAFYASHGREFHADVYASDFCGQTRYYVPALNEMFQFDDGQRS